MEYEIIPSVYKLVTLQEQLTVVEKLGCCLVGGLRVIDGNDDDEIDGDNNNDEDNDDGDGAVIMMMIGAHVYRCFISVALRWNGKNCLVLRHYNWL